MSARVQPLVHSTAAAAGPDFVSRPKHPERSARHFAAGSPQGMGAAGRAGLAGRDARKLPGALQFGDPPFQCVDARRQALESFPHRHLVEEFQDV